METYLLLDIGDREAVDTGSARSLITRDPVERRDQRCRVVHEIDQIIEPAARIGHRPTVKLGLLASAAEATARLVLAAAASNPGRRHRHDHRPGNPPARGRPPRRNGR